MDTDNSTHQVSFEEEKYTHANSNVQKRSFMVSLVMNLFKGRIKNEKQAGYVLLGFVALLVCISFFFLFGGAGQNSPDTFTPPANALPGEVIPPAL